MSDATTTQLCSSDTSIRPINNT